MLRHLEHWRSLGMYGCGHRTQLPAQRTGLREQERALPSQRYTPAGPSGVKLLEFTYGQQDKKREASFTSLQHLGAPINHHCPSPK